MIDAAAAEVDAVSFEEARHLVSAERITFIDIRDIRELWREGMVPGAMHVPRGMLEFWFHPESPYHKPALGKAVEENHRFILYCASGWRSALGAKALQDMGVPNIAHMSGGFTEWKDAGGEVAEKKRS